MLSTPSRNRVVPDLEPQIPLRAPGVPFPTLPLWGHRDGAGPGEVETARSGGRGRAKRFMSTIAGQPGARFALKGETCYNLARRQVKAPGSDESEARPPVRCGRQDASECAAVPARCKGWAFLCPFVVKHGVDLLTQGQMGKQARGWLLTGPAPRSSVHQPIVQGQ